MRVIFRSIPFVDRRTGGGTRAAVCAEATAMLLAVRLRGRAPLRPEMEGGEARRAARDGGVRHLAARRHHRGDLPGSSQYGQSTFYLQCE